MLPTLKGHFFSALFYASNIQVCLDELSRFLSVPIKPCLHLCDKHNTNDISISTRNMFLFSCAYAYVACVMLIAQV